ncbi:MAG: hypothetical protein ABR607_16145 [Pyrinomonadaceae bacterium]
MHLIQILLPLSDPQKQKFPHDYFEKVREDLAKRFGGVTAFVRSPAVGLWKESDEEISRDDVLLFEVITDRLDNDWWTSYREQLQEKFQQDEVLIWASNITKL